MASIPSPLETYASLPFQFPLFEAFPVVRIPIAGPEPFNTLVVVRSTGPLGQYRVSDNKLHRFSYILRTGFRLIGFDPRVPPPFEHSTTGAINMLQTSDDSPFVVALDEVTGFFDGEGNWVISVKAAEQWDEVYAAETAHISSWILCYEPPPAPDLPKGGRPIDWKALVATEAFENLGPQIGLAGAGPLGHPTYASPRRPLAGASVAKAPGYGDCK